MDQGPGPSHDARSRKSSGGTLGAISEDLKSAVVDSGRFTSGPVDLIVMDGAVKTLTTEWVEEGGRILESLRVDSIPDDLIHKGKQSYFRFWVSRK